MGPDFVILSAGTAPGTTGNGTVTIAMPVILIILASLMLANGKAPKLAGFCLFLAGVGLSGTAMAGSLSDSAHTVMTGTVQAITDALS